MDILEHGLQKMGYALGDRQREQFEVYSREILDWNRKLNLTTITDYEKMQVVHFLDSLTLAQAAKPGTLENGCRLIDVGTGAGLPGIPLKIVFPSLKVTLLEATAKKTEFLKYLVSVLKLDEIEVVTARAEDQARLGKYREAFDIVTARAVTQLAALAELTLPFCVIGGRCILPKKGDTAREIEEAGKAVETLGGTIAAIQNIDLEGLDDNRHLVVLEKTAPTPDKYPRRSGMPEKRPIK